MKMQINHLVVFDGTSAYIISVNDLETEIEENEVEVLGKFTSFHQAEKFCDNCNENEI